ncbi:histidine utilization repressor [Enterobacter sp. R1(2018)]|jgi:GntR family histidine utilization transcriptional repressor|uniref:histidine utilization repressor n=1 Tax=Enterobacteriaceae TaxID=543 RepID=UPI000EAEE54D|nr:histidine utilization repressor [Enterobacter sp. R1(2018)]RKQ38665.1 histidine utilization repressor [Enterobacter sp. R1(2018)]
MSALEPLEQLRSAISDLPAPIYQRVKQAIIGQIRGGAWLPHQRVPSETELVSALNVSRMTINRALRELTSEGWLVRMQGVGTFVAELKGHTAMLEVRSIAEEIAARGHHYRNYVVALEQVAASAELAHAFSVQPGEPLFYSQMVHYDNDEAVQLETRYVNPALAADYLRQDFRLFTPHHYLSQVAPLTAGEHIVEAVLADETQQALLEVTARQPCLLVKRRTWHHAQVVTVARLLYPGSRYQLVGSFTGQ